MGPPRAAKRAWDVRGRRPARPGQKLGVGVGAFTGAESGTGAPSSGRLHVLPRQGRHSPLPSSSSKEGPLCRDTVSTWPWCSRTWGLGSAEPGALTGCRDLWGAHPHADGGKNDVSGDDQRAGGFRREGPGRSVRLAFRASEHASGRKPADSVGREGGEASGCGSETQVPSGAWPQGHWELRAGTGSASRAVTLPMLLPGHRASRCGDGPP